MYVYIYIYSIILCIYVYTYVIFQMSEIHCIRDTSATAGSTADWQRPGIGTSHGDAADDVLRLERQRLVGACQRLVSALWNIICVYIYIYIYTYVYVSIH